ncbi:uncharacterized protein LOC103475913 [Poecilia reticulata]|uniref:uncharacterized protein LOC103475913 n=1 Tax=Poecilia reticulata TaxID=8081 RepID=UPI0004A4D2FE|nr:PREDICTED: uncharacterized protein LOC103475913 [Poecilia reticulata]
MTLLKLIFLLSTWSFTATESWMTHYLRKNSSVCLHVKKPPSHISGRWTFNGKLVAAEKYIDKDYAERMVFISENLTMCINRLTENDTGNYKASYFSNFIEQSENHQVILQGMVPRPVMTVTPENHSSVSAETCNFTVNCSIQDDWLGSICHRNGCRTSQKSFNKFNITILSDNTTVVCISNNHVSRNNISQNIPTPCLTRTDLELKEDFQKHSNIFYIFIIAIAVVIFFIVVIAIKYCKAKHDQESTCSAQLIQSGPLESQQPSEPRVSTSSSEADPSYENVETSQPREISILVHEQGISEVDTVYSVPRKAASCVKSDKKQDALQDENTQKTLTSGCADVNKDQSSTQTETVYSVLQMPKNLNT